MYARRQRPAHAQSLSAPNSVANSGRHRRHASYHRGGGLLLPAAHVACAHVQTDAHVHMVTLICIGLTTGCCAMGRREHATCCALRYTRRGTEWCAVRGTRRRAAQVAALRADPAVDSLVQDVIQPLTTFRTPAFLGMEGGACMRIHPHAHVTGVHAWRCACACSHEARHAMHVVMHVVMHPGLALNQLDSMHLWRAQRRPQSGHHWICNLH